MTSDDAYPDAPLPVIDPAQAIGVIVAFIRHQMEQAGFGRLVIGLSGGVDSAAVAFLAARAIGAENLLAVRMPYRTSSEASETDALRVVDALGCQTRAGRHLADGRPDAGAHRRLGHRRDRCRSTCGAAT